MMKLLRVIVIFICSVCLSSLLSAQECKEQLKQYFNQMNSINNPEKGVVYFLNISFEYSYWNPKKNMPINNVQISFSSDVYNYESVYFSVYTDRRDLFYVDKLQKTIIHSKGNLNAISLGELKDVITRVQFELLDKGRISTCKDTLIDKKQYLFIEVTSGKELNEKSKIDRMVYLLSGTKEMKVDRVYYYYTKKNLMKSLIITYNEIDFNYKKKKLQKVNDVFFDSNGHLKSDFKGFTYSEKIE
jgi:hypothetical protein